MRVKKVATYMGMALLGLITAGCATSTDWAAHDYYESARTYYGGYDYPGYLYGGVWGYEPYYYYGSGPWYYAHRGDRWEYAGHPGQHAFNHRGSVATGRVPFSHGPRTSAGGHAVGGEHAGGGDGGAHGGGDGNGHR